MFSLGLAAQDSDQKSLVVKGYRDNIYGLSGNSPQKICEYDLRFISSWCIDNPENSMGLYMGFKQLLTYSKTSIQFINKIKRKVQWSISMDDVHKLHINYPTIVTFSNSSVIKGYDFFTGYLLWEKKTDYISFFESGIDLWMISQDSIDKLDVISSEIVQTIPFKDQVNNIVGTDIHLFIESNDRLIFMDIISLNQTLVGLDTTIKNVSSDYVLVSNDELTKLLTYDNNVISENVQHTLFLVETPIQTYFGYIKDDHINFLREAGNLTYKFTENGIQDKIDYAYKIKDALHVFYDNQQILWKLEQVDKSQQSDQDI